MKRSLALLAVAALFFVGVVVGILGTHLFYARQLQKPGGLAALGNRLFVASLERRLDLTAEQRQEIDAILEESRREGNALRQEVAPRVMALVERTSERIEEVLTPEQRRKYERLRRRHRRRAELYLLGR